MASRKRRRKRWWLAAFLGPPLFLIAALHVVDCWIALHDRDMTRLAATLTTNWAGGRLRWYERRVPDAKWEIVFIHGTPASGAVFGEQFRRPLPAANLRALDRPGFGGSGPGPRRPSLEDHAAAVGALLPPAGAARRVILVGHSYGAPVALAAALKFTNAIAGLLLIGASVDPGLEQLLTVQRVADGRLLSWLVPQRFRQCNRELLTLRDDLAALGPRLAQLRVPVVMLHGGQDRQVPVANVDYLRARFAAAGTGELLEAMVRADFNHFIPWEQPAAVEEALRLLIARVAARSTHPGGPAL